MHRSLAPVARLSTWVVAATLSLGFVSNAHAAAWEIVSKSNQGTANPDRIAGQAPVSIKQMSRHAYLPESNSTTWVFFTLHVDTTTVPTTRHMIVFHDVGDARMQKLIETLELAWRSGRKVRWFRDESRDRDVGPVAWQGYSNFMYSVYAADQVELILE